MKILITGAKGFVGKNLVYTLNNIKEGKDRTRPNLFIEKIFEYDIDTDTTMLDEFCQEADFVFNLAGVNRPKEQTEFMTGNYGFAMDLLQLLKKYDNKCPVMLSSSTQATLLGRFADSKYGMSKQAGENLFMEYEQETGAKALIYRFPNLFGKWCRPNYNSAVATFCHNIANDLPIMVNDPSTELELIYIDDLVNEMLDALEGKEHRCNYDGLSVLSCVDGKYCYVPVTYKSTLGEIVSLIKKFDQQSCTLRMPEIPEGSLAKKLYSTYLSYLPERKMKYAIPMNVDNRGSFNEVMKTVSCGQISINVSKPGMTKGEHWHHSKWEIFIVVSGHGLIQQRELGTNEIYSFEVTGEKLEAVQILPGYAHNIMNLSKTDNLVVLMWANEPFDPAHPETYREFVNEEEYCMGLKTDYTDVKFKEDGRIKLLIIVGTRPEIIRLSAIITKCRRYFDCILAHTGQNYDYNLNGVFFRDLKLDDPDAYMDAVGDDLGETVGNIISCSYKLMRQIKPDALLILGDTNSCLSAISAKRLHIPIFHMEAGNRCKDECLPEETNRRIVDIISDVNLAYSEHARKYLHECGLPKERIYVTGSPMAEVLLQNMPEIMKSDILSKLGLQSGKYILLSAHREENIDTEKNFMELFQAINKLAEKYDMPILYSCHPRSRERLKKSEFKLDRRIIQHEPLGFHDYNCLQMNAFAVVSDSGTLPEESSFFTSQGYAFPAICIRTSTERPEALDKGDFVLAGIDEKSLVQAVEIAVSMNYNNDLGIPVPDYVEENVSTKVVKIIQSYVGIVNRMVWRKY